MPDEPLASIGPMDLPARVRLERMNRGWDIVELERRSSVGRTTLYHLEKGTLSLSGRKSFEERIVEGVGAAFCGMRIHDEKLVLEPSDADMDDIDRSGFVRVAADRLKALAEDAADPERSRLARLALRRLYIEHLRQAGQQ